MVPLLTNKYTTNVVHFEGGNMKRIKLLLFITCAIMTTSLAQVGSGTMYVKVNGNSYPIYDLFSDTIKSVFRIYTDSIKNELQAQIILNCQQSGQLCGSPTNYRYLVPWPRELKSITYITD